MKSVVAAKLAAGTALAISGVYLGGTLASAPKDRGVTVVTGGAPSTGTSTADAAQPRAAAAAAAAPAGCMSRSASLPWGDLGARTWTPTNNAANEGTPANAGIRTGQPFAARLVQAYGIDTEFSRRTVILEMADGCRRQYQSASFSAADLGYVTDQIARHPFPADPASYATSITEEGQVTQAQVSSGQVKTYQTQHFNIMYGVKTGYVSYTYQATRPGTWQDFLVQAGKTLEYGWTIDRHVLGAPMPYGATAQKKKMNVYICGTGLPFANGDTEDCGASAAAAIYASSIYLQPGSTSLWHEFGHSIQFYSGGFRDKPEAGPIWETNANFVAFASSPHYDAELGQYLSNLESGPLWSVPRYGAHPFMSYLFEKDALRKYVWSPWTANLRDASGATTEDFVQALVRQAKADGVYPAGYQSFAEDMGWYGARMAAGDLLNQKTLLDLRNSAFVAKLYAPLQTTGTAGTFASPAARALLQWGTHIVPLTPSAGTITASVTGGTAANSAAWRYAIVSLAPNGTPRYSTLGSVAGTAKGGTVSLPTVAGEKAFLVVTATPYAYQSLGWQQPGKTFGFTFPYRVAIGGAAPLTGSATACNSVPAGEQGQDLNWNTNGNSELPKPCP